MLHNKDTLANYCKAIEKNFFYALDGIMSAISLTLCSIVMVSILHWGILGYLAAVEISNMYLAYVCRIHKILFQRGMDWRLIRAALVYCFPLVWNRLFWWVIQMSDRYMVAYIW